MEQEIYADYYSESHDEKTSGKMRLRADTVVAIYSLPGYSKRTMVITEHGLKFCVKGKPSDFEFNTPSGELLAEATI